MGMGGEKRSWSTGRGLRRVALLAVWYGGVWTACAAATGGPVGGKKAGLLAINTWPWTNATATAFEKLAKGRSAVDAVEAGCSACELLQCDGTVGYGGSPASDGEVTLDAMIMDGATGDMGAVGCLRRVRRAISVARAVMDHTSHSLLVGDKATAFAVMLGFAEEALESDTSAYATAFAVMLGFAEEALESDVSNALHAQWRAAACQPNFYRKIPDSNASCPPYPPLSPPVLQEKEKEEEKETGKDEDFEDEKHSLPAAHRVRGREKERRKRERESESESEREREGEEKERARLEEVNTQISRENHDTIGMVAIDSFNNIAAGTSTNGARHKIGGRVSDAAVPGAGAYVDAEVGAAVATGDGDIMMRFLPSFQAVNYMRAGMAPVAACQQALAPIVLRYPGTHAGLVCVTKQGTHGAAAHGWVFHYSYQDSSLASPVVVEVLPTK